MRLNRYLRNSLETLGLTTGEALVYLKILQKPGVNISAIKPLCGYSTAGIYKIINFLIDKKFITAAGKPATYTAISLSSIADRFAAQGRRLARISGKLKSINGFEKISLETEVFNGDNLTDFYLNIPYKIDDFIWCVGSFTACVTFMGQEVEKDFIKSRVKRGMSANAIIFDKSVKSIELAGRDRLEKRETKFIQRGEYPLEFSCLFGSNYLNFYRDADGKINVIKTESPDFARARLIQYQTIWNSTAQ